MRKIFNYTIALAMLLSASSCDLNELPVDTATNEAVFGSESGLELYANSFYDLLPGTDVGVFQDDDNSDLVARNGVDNYLAPNALSPITSSGWNWTDLRNINYYIENTEKSTVPTKTHYLGVARFFRALFYFEKVKRFGDVPWIDKTIPVTDTAMLFAARDNRFDVMDKVLADLNYAIENITLTADPSCTRITKNVARAYKTRICLFEASFRKYHTDYNKQATADAWYEEVVKEANEIRGFTLHQGATADRGYRELFIAKSAFTDETILSVALSANLQVFSSANRRFISPTYGNRPSLTRRFINTYLNLDGTPFTSNAAYATTPFVDEVQNRDLRLKQTIRTGDYRRTENSVPVIAPPNFNQTYTGYQPIKWCYDERFPFDDESRNDNAHIIMRWAEVLLNKAEALAELNRMTDADWTATIGALRKRAGITGVTLTTAPTVADPYMITFFANKFTNPVLLEVLRERGVELVFEGLRPDDLRRWKLGELFQNAAMNGMYVPALGEYDLNGDGIKDVYFYQGTKPTSTTPGIAFVDVSTSTAVGRIQLSNGTSGEVIWNPGPRQWIDAKYLYPIPQTVRDRNIKLGQNPGWQ
ncbi:RagB/SusD family nutrient uptake outer membrane protein [uncultured Chitinophaga sp.]|uniref:RagB/SusD family nutrient uptake outer membrane protein n=1 Tax=uncultured Chitinophaga sp. TaxID=339340 RepID=UPI0025D815B2|nr:RagB/SusD family nutrient uptake outer membrane protein [uncultured Chitinophaga sp.]